MREIGEIEISIQDGTAEIETLGAFFLSSLASSYGAQSCDR